MIRIKSKKPGFRRCGITHATEFVEYPADRFSKTELAILKSEPMLVVEVTDAEPPGKPKGKGKK